MHLQFCCLALTWKMVFQKEHAIADEYYYEREEGVGFTHNVSIGSLCYYIYVKKSKQKMRTKNWKNLIIFSSNINSQMTAGENSNMKLSLHRCGPSLIMKWLSIQKGWIYFNCIYLVFMKCLYLNCLMSTAKGKKKLPSLEYEGVGLVQHLSLCKGQNWSGWRIRIFKFFFGTSQPTWVWRIFSLY